ncbi:MAG: hypothetical protein ACYTKD_13060 [Planctomycetota bacterium]
MRRMLIPALLLMAALPARGAYLTDKAIEGAALDAVAKIDAAKLGDVKSVAVLPLWNDDGDGYAAIAVKGHLTSTGLKVLARSEKEWASLLDEIEWNAKREDVMDATTVQRFGKIKGCDAVLYGTVREVTRSLWGFRGSARLSLFIADVETGEIVWSSGPVEGEAFAHWSDLIVRFWNYPLVWVIVLVVVVVGGVVLLLRRAARPR